jgi:signal transduction histidine kinase
MSIRGSLLAKIYLATVVAVTTLFAAAGWFFVYQASAAIHSAVEQEVRASLATVDASLESRNEHLATASALLASMSDIRTALGTHDPATISDSAEEFWSRADARHEHVRMAVFAVVGPDGVVVASGARKTPSALARGTRIPDSVLNPARQAFPSQSRAFSEWDGAVWQVLVTPVYVDSSNHPALLDILVAAHPLTRQTLLDLKDRTGGIDFLLRSQGRTTLATVNSEAAARIVSQPRHFAIRATTLRDSEGQGLAELWAVRPLEEVESRISALSAKMIIGWLVAMTVGLGLSYALARRIVRPVHTLNDAALEISRENYSVRVPEDSQDELGLLSRTFNRMCASIQASRDEQVRSGQMMAVGRLAASIAHDLRNPLAAVVGGSEMLADFDLPPDQIKQTATHVNKAARRMEQLLVEIGQVARAKTSERVECRLAELVAAAVDSQEARAAAQGVLIRQSVEGDMTVRCERSRIERVLVNLISNALEVMAGGGEIAIRVWDDLPGRMAWVEVSDSGPGVAKEIRAQLFQPFVTAGKRDGLGLGLALARQTLVEYGGDLELVDSEKGARFRLRIPAEDRSQ